MNSSQTRTTPSLPVQHVGGEFDFEHVVLQPTTRCNLNCTYCYLPDRSQSSEMSTHVASAIASSLLIVPHKVTLLWHGGEPLSCGLRKFRELVKPFSALRRVGRIGHSLQTNATLITDQWCDFFREEDFKVGVSIDGPKAQNLGRLNWAGNESFDSVLKGMNTLRQNGIKFATIAVVNECNVDDPATFYNFFLSIGCERLNINIKEREGLYRLAKDLDFEQVRRFWKGLFDQWRAKPVLPIREFNYALGWMEGICTDDRGASRPPRRDLWPTVSVNGDVGVVSPEFMAAAHGERDRFVVGNVTKTPLHEIVKQSWQSEYVREFFLGVDECKRVCPYFSYCGGGQGSNKYFELGTLNGTETAHCRNTRQAVVDAVLGALSDQVRA